MAQQFFFNQIQKNILENQHLLIEKKSVKFLVVLNKFFWAPVIRFTMMLGLLTTF